LEIGETARESLRHWLEIRGGRPEEFLFPSRIDHTGHISTRQYARLVDEWVAAIGLDPALFGSHSIRRTKASLIYKRTGNLRAVQILLGHRKIESTVRYLGVDLEDALALSEGTDV
jgi:integrase